MSSERKIAANQRNARNSTGPRTAHGKATASLNATKHGLSARPMFDVETEARIAAMAEALLERGQNDPTTMGLARAAAEAQIMVERVDEAKRLVWDEVPRHRYIVKRGKYAHYNDPRELNALPDNIRDGVLCLIPIAPHLFAEPFEDDAERDAEVIRMATKELTKLIRYERRAANQRDKALRALTEITTDIEDSL